MLILLAGGVGLLALLMLALPFALVHVDCPELVFELPTNVTAKVGSLATNRTFTARLQVRRGRAKELAILARGRLLDWPYTLSVDADYSLFGCRAEADFTFRLDGTDWRFSGNFAGSPSEWRAEAEMRPSAFSQTDPFLSSLLARLPMPAVSNLVFSGSVEAGLSAEKTCEIPVVVWSAKGRLREADASASLNGKPLRLGRFSTGFGAEGIANRVMVRPMYPRLAWADYDGIAVTNVSAAVRMTENSLLVTEAGAGFCGGKVKLYSLYLNPRSLSAGFTLFLEDIDTNKLIAHLRGFRGEATGRLQGKLPVFLRNGRELRLGSSYLYSIPGETGTLRLHDATLIVENLAASGVDEGTTANVANALANLSYRSLKFNIRRNESGEGLALAMSVDGSATSGETTVPVSVAVTFRGDIEQLINTGLRATGK